MESLMVNAVGIKDIRTVYVNRILEKDCINL
jgi:hypothetical protein